jgi:SAM-dependent methyltransferase
MKPYAESCEQNREPIIAVLRRLFADRSLALEIGSGTGQHAVYFAPQLPHLHWQTSDRDENHPGINAWLDEYGLANVSPPLSLDVTGDWPERRFDAVFSANTAHIMSWPQVECFFRGVGQVLESGGCFALYGPFNFGGEYTSESNRSFDAWLQGRDPHSGIRNFEDLNGLAEGNRLTLMEDIAMPANNRILVWRKV